jgi:hypothetical protein
VADEGAALSLPHPLPLTRLAPEVLATLSPLRRAR